MRTVERLNDLNGAIESIPLCSNICDFLLIEQVISRVGITMDVKKPHEKIGAR